MGYLSLRLKGKYSLNQLMQIFTYSLIFRVLTYYFLDSLGYNIMETFPFIEEIFSIGIIELLFRIFLKSPVTMGGGSVSGNPSDVYFMNSDNPSSSAPSEGGGGGKRKRDDYLSPPPCGSEEVVEPSLGRKKSRTDLDISSTEGTTNAAGSSNSISIIYSNIIETSSSISIIYSNIIETLSVQSTIPEINGDGSTGVIEAGTEEDHLIAAFSETGFEGQMFQVRRANGSVDSREFGSS
jgi:hypothetical protein